MRPRLVLFGDSITQQSFAAGGWGAALADHFARKVSVAVPPLPALPSCCSSTGRRPACTLKFWLYCFLVSSFFPFDSGRQMGEPLPSSLQSGIHNAQLLSDASWC
ncbi:hypothetical protein ABZP36_025072 [Zizania latifolia]